MPSYRYQGTQAGREVAGEIAAADFDAARRALAEQGIHVTLCEPSGGAPAPPPPRLAGDEALEWSQQLVQLAQTSRPLAAGFHAAADESSHPRIASALQYVATQLEQGTPLETVLAGASDWLPPAVAGLVAATARTGKVATALSELVDHQRDVQSLWHGIRDRCTYLLVMAVLSGVVLLALLFGATASFDRMFREFGLTLPLTTRLLFWWRDTGTWWAGAAILAIAAGSLVYRRQCGAAAWARLVDRLPVIGPIYRWLGLAEMASLLGVLIRHEIPLPEALTRCAAGIGHAAASDMAAGWACRVAAGQPLADVLAAEQSVPAAAVPIIAWGENAGLLADALGALREMLLQRVQGRVALLQAIVPPILFLTIGCFALLIVGGLFVPLGWLLRGLT